MLFHGEPGWFALCGRCPPDWLQHLQTSWPSTNSLLDTLPHPDVSHKGTSYQLSACSFPAVQFEDERIRSARGLGLLILRGDIGCRGEHPDCISA